MQTGEIDTIFIALAFSGIGIIVAIVVLFGIFINRKNTLIQKQLKDELIYQKKLYDVELNALRSQMNPHFVHNSLNAIQYYIQKNDIETSENYLSKFSKLMRQFFDYSRRHSITVAEEISLLENYLQIEKLRFEEKLSYTISIDSKLSIEDVYIPSMLLQSIVENAINHGIFHKKGKGNIYITFTYITEESFNVTIVDDGIGINKALKLNRSIAKDKNSNSSSVLEKRLDLLKENKQWEIEYTTTDRSINENTSGTAVKLIFKALE